MNPKVSVIVPVYGAEAFLPTCISSLRAQTLRDIELIFVCDGSPDNSLAILRRVEPLDSRIRVIAFEENQGVSAARNLNSAVNNINSSKTKARIVFTAGRSVSTSASGTSKRTARAKTSLK